MRGPSSALRRATRFLPPRRRAAAPPPRRCFPPKPGRSPHRAPRAARRLRPPPPARPPAAQKKKALAAEAEGGADEGAAAEAAAEEEAPPPAAGAGGDEEDDDDFGLKKGKKKKKAKKPTDDDEGADADGGEGEGGAGGGGDDDEFGLGKKKKKKVPSKKAEEEEEGGAEDDEGDEGADVPLPEDIHDDLGVQWEGEVRGAETQIQISGDRDYKYDEMLSRMFQLLLANNPELAGDRKRFVMKPPQVVRDGAKKVVFVNFPEICKAMRRTGEHVFNFMLAELGTTGSIDGSQRMVIKGRFQPKAVEHVIRKYVSEYVMCSSCKSPDTDLHKENRLYFAQCNKCGARRSVAAITAGYKAQIGRRIKTG